MEVRHGFSTRLSDIGLLYLFARVMLDLDVMLLVRYTLFSF